MAKASPSNPKKRKRSLGLVVAILLLGCLLLGWLEYGFAGDKRERVRVSSAMLEVESAEKLVQEFRKEHGVWPTRSSDIGLVEHHTEDQSKMADSDEPQTIAFNIALIQKQLVVQFDADQDRLANTTLIFRPVDDTLSTRWTCTEGTVESRYRPMICRKVKA
jgi:hypothetical protein